MKSKIAGVALAAVMACGWAGGAEASTMATIDFDVAILGSTYSGSVDLSFDNGAGSVSNLSLVINGFDYGQYAYAVQSLALQNGSVYGYELDTSIIPGDINSIVLDTDTSVTPLGLIYFQDAAYSCTRCVTVTNVTGTLLPINPVPLPATAPLFGAAVLTLGAAGYGLRRSPAAA